MIKKTIGLIAIGLIVIVGLTWLKLRNEYHKLESDDPLVWESAISKFEKGDRVNPSAESAVLFVGSSSIRFWRTLTSDMAPIPVIKRGFGGAKVEDVVHYTDRIIWPYSPKAIVLFVGTNDISGRHNDKSPTEVKEEVQTLVLKIRKKLPQTPIYYISITPTRARWDIWENANEANHLIKDYSEALPNFHFLDMTSHFLDEKGMIDEGLLFWDGVHLNKKGYALWTSVIKNRLLEDLDFQL